MIFWFWVVLAMGVAAATLSLSSELAMADFLTAPAAFLLLPLFFAVSLLALAYCSARPRAASLSAWALRAAVFVLFFVSLALFSARVYQAYQSDFLLRPSQKARVVATVEIHELSDSVQDADAQLRWRQKAVLRDIRPVNPQSAYTPPAEMAAMLYDAQDASIGADLRLKVGQKATMTLDLSPIASGEKYGFDARRWLLSRHAHANAKVVAVDKNSVAAISGGGFLLGLQKGREHYRDIFYSRWQNAPSDKKQALAVTLSLLTGDRALIDKATYDLYRYGGIMHLLAISGAHVLFLAALLASLLVFLTQKYAPFVYCRVERWQIRAAATLSAAFLYALFVGFDPPAARTVFMLLVASVARQLLVAWSPLRVLAFCAVLMVFLDPFALWQAGFWLSVVAVAILIQYETQKTRLASGAYREWDGYDLGQAVWAKAKDAVRLQSYVFVAMLPISVFLFGQVSLVGAVSNLLAVGLFGALIVPLNLLAGVIAAIAPSLAWGVWGFLTFVLEKLAWALQRSRALFGESWLAFDVSVASVLLFLFALLLARGFLASRFALLPLLAAFFALLPAKPDSIVRVAVLEDSAASHVLIRQDDAAWLVMAAQARALDDEKIANWLYQNLKKHGVRRLDGVIIQDGSLALLLATERLDRILPVGGVWWADKPRQQGRLRTQTCRAGVNLPLPRGQIRILTGWSDTPINDCAVLLISDDPAYVEAFLPSQDEATLFARDKTATLIDNSADADTWALYDLLCDPKDDGAFVDTLLLSSKTPAQSGLYPLAQRPRVAFSHALSGQQKNAARLILAQDDDESR